MSLDIPLSEDCLDEYEAMKMKSIYRFIVFVIKDETEIQIETKAPSETPISNLIKYLPPTEARFILLRLTYLNNDDVPPRKVAKMIAIRWCPSGTPQKQKFFQKFNAKLSGIHKATEAFSPEELDEKALLELFK